MSLHPLTLPRLSPLCPVNVDTPHGKLIIIELHT